MEYEEREDEFDIVSLFLDSAQRLRSQLTFLVEFQEDESEIALRKMKAEEEEIDILSGMDTGAQEDDQRGMVNGDDDEEAAWATGEPDEDEAGWRMKLWMEDDDLMM